VFPNWCHRLIIITIGNRFNMPLPLYFWTIIGVAGLPADFFGAGKKVLLSNPVLPSFSEVGNT
jgi:hypothetical protein